MPYTFTPGFHCAESISANGVGAYLAYPTTEVLKPTYKGHRTLVNYSHTKVGITTQTFKKRWGSYRGTFDGEVAFYALFELPLDAVKSFESCLLLEMRTRYPRSGPAKEWFATDDRHVIAELMQKVRVMLM